MDSVSPDQAKLDEIRRKAAASKVTPAAPIKTRIRKPLTEPLISKILYVLAIGSIISGLALFKQEWESDSSATIFLMLGLVQGVLFISIGLALTYLKGIYENTRDN